MKRWDFKLSFKNYIRSNQNIAAVSVAIIAMTIIFSVLFQTPRPGVMDYGEYSQILYDVGLNWTQEELANSSELQFVKIIEQYDMNEISVLQLLQLEPTQTLVYPVRIVCFICGLFKIKFSTAYLAALLSFVAIACIYSITRSLYCFFKEFCVVIGMIICFILLCGNHIVYFNSLYDDGTFLVCLLLYSATILHIIVAERRKGLVPMLKLIIASLFLINSFDMGIFLAPVVLIIAVLLMVYCMPGREKLIPYITISVILLFFITHINIRYTIDNESDFYQTRIYHAFFTGLLENTQEPEVILQELGLPKEIMNDIGKSAYLSKEEYMIAPTSEGAWEIIFNKLDYMTLFKMYYNHPDILKNVLAKEVKNAGTIDISRVIYNNQRYQAGLDQVERFIWWQWLRNIIVPSSTGGYMLLYAVNIIASLIYIIFKRREKNKVFLGLFYISVVLMSFILFLTTCTFRGFAEMKSILHFMVITFDILCVANISAVIYLIWKGIDFLSIHDEKVKNENKIYELAVEQQEVINSENPILVFGIHFLRRINIFMKEKFFSKPERGALLLTVVSLIIMIYVLFCPRIGAYNNGDFSRMMTAMNLTYTDEDKANYDELALTKITEVYNWEENYDYTKIMFYNADLTQAWVSLIIKVIDNLVGMQFSTVYVTIIYVIILAVCFYYITKSMFTKFGPQWIWLGVISLFVLFGIGNLGWLNSLFGEGPAFVGLMMIIASSLYIISREKGKCSFSFLILLFSINFFIGSKAQFTLTAPILLIWTLILSIYHTPKRWWKLLYYPSLMVLFVVVAISGVNIYKNNESRTSKDTIYQSIFYGALMISEDPVADLLELGLDPAMVADIGKNAYLDSSEYYCAPRSEMAEEIIYKNVNTFTMLRFYLRHPDKLLIMMDASAEAAAQVIPDYVLYVGDKVTQEHDSVDKMKLWENLRPYFVGSKFWQLVVVYGIILIFSIGMLVRKKYDGKSKLYICLYLVIAGLGIIQFPLTTIGNGFADNTKQLYMFRLTYDITMFIAGYTIIRMAKEWINKRNETFEENRIRAASQNEIEGIGSEITETKANEIKIAK